LTFGAAKRGMIGRSGENPGSGHELLTAVLLVSGIRTTAAGALTRAAGCGRVTCVQSLTVVLRVRAG